MKKIIIQNTNNLSGNRIHEQAHWQVRMQVLKVENQIYHLIDGLIKNPVVNQIIIQISSIK